MNSHKFYFLLTIFLTYEFQPVNSQSLSRLRSTRAQNTNNAIAIEFNQLSSVDPELKSRSRNPSAVDSSCSVSQSDLYLTTQELVERKGYGFESHNVVTQNAYILQLHRILPPSNTSSKRSAKEDNKSRKVVFLVHGMTQSSRDFLLNCDKRAIGYKLSDAGFDVWLANLRGNRYSNKHLTLTKNDAAYWNFTVDELIKYDAPAMVNTILNKTGAPSLTWIGYSLGTAMAMGFLSSQPSYNSKVSLFISLGTVAYVGKSKSRPLRFISRFHRLEAELLTRYNKGRLASDRTLDTIHRAIPLLCMPEVVLNVPLYCQAIIGSIFGFNFNQANPRLIAILGSGTPNAWSAKVLLQWFQWIQSGTFNYFDYGPAANQIIYGSTAPPVYNLTGVSTKVVNFWADNDSTVDPQDVQKVVDELPNVVANIRVSMPAWNHLDYVYGKDADIYVYEPIINAINKFA